MTFISVVSLVFLFSVKKLRDDLRKELRGHAATGVFLFLLFAATVVLSVSAMRETLEARRHRVDGHFRPAASS